MPALWQSCSIGIFWWWLLRICGVRLLGARCGPGEVLLLLSVICVFVVLALAYLHHVALPAAFCTHHVFPLHLADVLFVGAAISVPCDGCVTSASVACFRLLYPLLFLGEHSACVFILVIHLFTSSCTCCIYATSGMSNSCLSGVSVHVAYVSAISSSSGVSS